MNTAYRALLAPEESSGFVVSFPDVPEALTSGDTKAEALGEARDCLIAALGGYIEMRRPVPKATARRGEPIYLPSLVVAKLALYEAMQREGLTAVALGERLGLSEGAIRRLLDLDHRSHLNNVESALAALGQKLLLEVVAQAEDAEDLGTFEEFERKVATGEEELIPADMVHRLVEGENAILVWREHRGLTQAQLAKAAGVGQTYISMIERGERQGTAAKLRAIARALKVQVDDLLAWEQYEESPELGPEFFEQADEYQGGKLVQRGRGPTVAPPSSRTTASSGSSGRGLTKRR